MMYVKNTLFALLFLAVAGCTSSIDQFFNQNLINLSVRQKHKPVGRRGKLGSCTLARPGAGGEHGAIRTAECSPAHQKVRSFMGPFEIVKNQRGASERQMNIY